MDVEKTIERWTDDFTTATQNKLITDLSQWSTESLEWLMTEHFQFSNRNTKLLWDAAQKTGEMDTPAVKEELIRNYNEELDHAAMYKRALKKIGLDVELRKEFGPTEEFLADMGRRCNGEPSEVLGLVYSGETAAVFESFVLREVARAVIARRGHGAKGNELVAFHDLHLSGVEQSHRDELGIFLRDVKAGEKWTSDGTRPSVEGQAALDGGKAAVQAMVTWWKHLFDVMIEKSKDVSVAA